ncbi:putative nuclease HARBI1 [Pleurodeles waltl]|uniref:putative nuclease HARBI1 n=1 Tax=Pleurodeles waltl TaxID=8319 RepID=UPI003709BE60
MWERIFCQRTTIRALREEEVIRLYHLKRESIVCLLQKIAPDITARVESQTTIPPMTKLLASLHMLTTGSFQTTAAQVGGISQPTFSAFLLKVLDAIIHLTPHDIRFPNTQQLQQETKQGFYQIAGFPHVLGAMDCTVVHIVLPLATKHLYRNHKHTHSINLQAIVDHCGIFTNILAKYLGSVHDAYIFRHSTINLQFQDGQYGNGLLIADQGYSIEPWVMTPCGNPTTEAEQAYNEGHRKTMNVVERTFGLLKSRFRCLAVTGGSLLYLPLLVCKIILVCAILHDICIGTSVPWDELVDVTSVEDDDNDALQEEGEQQNTAARLCRRQQIVLNVFM